MRASAASPALQANIDAEILAFNPSQLTKFLDECREIRLPRRVGRRAIHEHADAPNALARLLRARCERPGGRAAEQRDELAPLHSITSSAATSRPGGTVRPSAFAVLRLTIVSNLVAACTGRSAGLSPRRMRST